MILRYKYKYIISYITLSFFVLFFCLQVQDGTYVSSMVEDASFLVHKSLRRSVSTRSEQAIMAVCNRVTEVRRNSGATTIILFMLYC